MRRIIAALSGGMLVMAALTGCREPSLVGVQKSDVFGDDGAPANVAIPQGTPIQVRLTSSIGTSHSAAGDAWEGVLASPVIVGDRALLHDGSVVHGQVRRSGPPSPSEPATLEITVTGIEENGLTHEVSADAAPIVAGSARADQLGARANLELKPGTTVTFKVAQQVAAR